MADNSKKLSGVMVKIIIDIVILVIGIVLLAVPNAAMQTITIILGIILLAYGGITLCIVLYKKDGRSPLVAIICIVLGILLLVFSGVFANTVLPFVIGIWMLIMGIVGLASAKHVGKVPMVMSIVAIALGVIILIGVFVGANVLAVLLGVCMLIYGISSIIDFIAVKGANN